jgi:BASS family bile acid:Na+ symporter
VLCCAISCCCVLQVGMQNSALASVLASVHFPSQPMAVVPCVLSACTHATLGSLLAGAWAAQQDKADRAAAAA